MKNSVYRLRRSVRVAFGGFMYSVLVAIILPSMTAHALRSGNYYYADNGDGTATITQYVGNESPLVIPSMLSFYPVTSIGAYSFFNCSAGSITIPNGVTNIGGNAFGACSAAVITIPDGLISVGGQTFYECPHLTSMTFPDSVTTIGEEAFFCCPALTDVTMPNGLSRIESSVFYGCEALTSVNIPGNVTSIGGQAFMTCTSLRSINIPNGVTNMDDHAFDGCRSLSSITVPAGVTRIGYEVFGYCSGATNIAIPNGVTNINGYAFVNCMSLPSITIPASVTSIGTGAFEGCSALTNMFFLGNAPSGTYIFGIMPGRYGTVYYYVGTSGWGPTFSGWTCVGIMPPQAPLIVTTPYGQGTPPAGTNWCAIGASVTAFLQNSPEVNGTTQYVCRGWKGTGDVPANGAKTNTAPFTITTNSTITWLWRTNFWLHLDLQGVGSISTNDVWLAKGTNITVTATPATNFVSWGGQTNGCTITSNKIKVPMTATRFITAIFNGQAASNDVPAWWLNQYGLTNTDAMLDIDHDSMLTWQEYLADSNPTNSGSVFRVSITNAYGKATVSWTPNLSTARIYTVYGATNLLNGVWVTPTNSSHRFFRVGVKLP
jgi:hypothetical protein